MARSRNIKPSIMDNDQLAEMPALSRLLFIYLWMLADREGRLEDRPKRIAAQALPYDRDANVDAMLSDLAGKGFITRYVVDGQAVIQIAAFAKHQTPHVREAASELPAQVQSTTKEVPEHSLGSAEASPRSPERGFLIPDSLIEERGCEESASADAARPQPTMASAVCLAIRAAGVQSVNPSHPDLSKLIEAGAEIGMFVAATENAVKTGKASFAYVLGTVKGQLADAQRAAANARASPASSKQNALESRNAATAARILEKLNGSE